MHVFTTIGALVTTVLAGAVLAGSVVQDPAVRPVDEKVLRDYAGVYQWQPDAFVYLQVWNEFTGKDQLTAFDESGEVRTLYPAGPDRFVAGPGAAVAEPIESRITFQRGPGGRIISMTWERDGVPPRVGRRAEIEKHEDVRFSNGAIGLEGTLISPVGRTRHAAVILVHASGPADRQQVLPLARFLVRHGIAVLAYDKRGVGGSSGDWNQASFDDLAGDALAAFAYLKTRPDVESSSIGLLGWSQAGWIMPLAAARAKGLAFLISVSGAGIPAAETTLDQARNEMAARGMKPDVVSQIVELMKLQYEFARSGKGWEEYAASRNKLAARIGTPPDTFPAVPDHQYWQFIRRLYFYDPAPALRQLRVPTLALFGELDNNILAGKNAAAWEAALKSGGHRDYTVRILPNANHLMLEAKKGSNAEMPSLQRFTPAYFTLVREWLLKRVRGAGA